jgi:hypothetical protein
MASIDSLPADQRAVLELVLRRGRSYDEIARLLSIDRAGVRQRALAAFDALGPKTRVAPNRRALITDYLLDALPGGVAEEVREHLLASASERAWARAVASELEGISEHPLPEIPTNGRGPRAKGEGTKAERTKPTRRKKAEVPVQAALSNGSPRELAPRRASRLGGAILLAAAAAVAIALVLVFVVFTGGSKHHASPPVSGSRSTPAAPTTCTAAANGIKLCAQINLTPLTGGTSPVGVAAIVQVQGKDAVVIRAQGLAPNSTHPINHYAVWLYNSPSDSVLVGAVKQAVGKNGQLETGGGIPANYSHFHQLLLTLETSAQPKRPGHVVLAGTRSGGL